MQKLIEIAVTDLISIIESKPDSIKVAKQFVLEELEAANNGNLFVQQRVQICGIAKEEFEGAMAKSWPDVDGAKGPQNFLLMLIMSLSKTIGMDAAANVRITIVEYVMFHYKFGKYNKSHKNNKIKKQINLFKIVVNKEKHHPFFTHLIDEKNKPIRAVLSAWGTDFEDRDNKFNKEFQTTFSSSFWEIYLHQCFKILNMEIDYSKASPDFIIKTPLNNHLTIEAVISNPADGDTPVTSTSIDLKERTEFLAYSCIRLLNAIDSKHKKYIKNYSALEHVTGKPFIIAVSQYEQPNSFIQNNETIIRVLYGQGIHLDETKEGLTFKQIFESTVKKNEKVNLDLGLFTNDKYKSISAIIFSTTATLSKAVVQSSLDCTVRSSRFHSLEGLIIDIKNNSEYFENHLDGLQIHHNPFAENPLDMQEFNNYYITHYRYDTELKEIINMHKDNTLISRNTWFTNL